eukprot:scaffold1954_cov268-Pinguiococcus_pyrenoidosus.AAC.142
MSMSKGLSNGNAHSSRAATENQPQLQEAHHGELAAVGHRLRLLGENLHDAPHADDVHRIPIVEAGVAVDQLAKGAPVDVLGRRAQGWQPTGENRELERLGVPAHVVQQTEPAEALAENSPLPVARQQRSPDRLAVVHDAVRAEVLEESRLRLRAAFLHEQLRRDDVRSPGAPLVQKQHRLPALLREQAAHPASAAEQSRRREARPALQVQKGRRLSRRVRLLVRVHLPQAHFPGEDHDLLSLRILPVPVQRHSEEVVRAFDPTGQLHRAALPMLAGGCHPRQRQRIRQRRRRRQARQRIRAGAALDSAHRDHQCSGAAAKLYGVALTGGIR